MAADGADREVEAGPATARLASVLSILVALCWGLLAGLVVCVPAGYYYRFWRESSPLRGNLDYSRATAAQINADWDLFQRLQQQNAFLGEFSPAIAVSSRVQASLLAAADDVIERYRNSSDPAIEDFDWQKAALCLRHAARDGDRDKSAQGKLALCNGYVNLLLAKRSRPSSGSRDGKRRRRISRKRRLCCRALPIRIWVWLASTFIRSKNVGKAIAELHEAQRLGFSPDRARWSRRPTAIASARVGIERGAQATDRDRAHWRSAICGWRSAISIVRASSTSRSSDSRT